MLVTKTDSYRTRVTAKYPGNPTLYGVDFKGKTIALTVNPPGSSLGRAFVLDIPIGGKLEVEYSDYDEPMSTLPQQA